MLFVNSPYNIVTCSCRSHRSERQLYLHSPHVPTLGSYYTGSMPPLHGRRHTQDSKYWLLQCPSFWFVFRKCIPPRWPIFQRYRYPISSRILRIKVYLILLKLLDFIKKTLLLIDLVLYSLSAFYSKFVFKVFLYTIYFLINAIIASVCFYQSNSTK